MILTTTDYVPGKTVTEILGVVRGNTIRARHMGDDLKAVFRNMIGGEIYEYTKLLAEARDQAIDRMVENANELGADAVINIDFATSEMMGMAAELMVYGTAVRLGNAPRQP